jgi:hypothetical protein
MTMTTPTTLARSLSFAVHAALLALLTSGCDGAATLQPDAAAAPLARTDADGLDASTLEADATTAVNIARLPVATACTSDDQCSSGHCADGVCCDGACDGECASCALTGKVGTCSPVVGTHDDTCEGESICDASGKCLTALGRACGVPGDCASGNCVDGVCCSSAACGTCQSCALPGSAGACTLVAKLDEDPDTCSGDGMACNGLGACGKRNGAESKDASECISRTLADGVCCDQACDGTCYSCDQDGRKGTCSPLNAVEDANAASACVVPRLCFLRGAAPVCKLADGAACSVNAECLSGSCLTTYPDADHDGYGDETVTVRRCETSPQAGFITRGGDCCDQDGDSSPATLTYRTFRNRCGSYDWNCDGGEEPRVGGGVR